MTTPTYLTTRNGLYAWTGPFETKDMVKSAGFRWHGPSDWCAKGKCRACKAGLGKVWWTDDKGKAARLLDYADAAARTSLVEHADAVQASRATDAVIDAPAPAGLAYMPFQRAGIAYGMAHPNVLLADEMGLGKSVESLGIINADPSIQRVLVICPASLRINWAREAQRWLVRPFSIYIAETNDAPPPEATLVIANYERVAKSGTALATALASTRWDAMIVDESHMLKSQEAKRTKAILGVPARRKGEPATVGLIANARRRILLTGTPITNRPVEFFPLLHALCPADFPSFFGYAKRYCDAKQVGIGYGNTAWDFTGASHLDELQDKVRSLCMIRRLKKDVLTELPSKVRQVVVLPTDDRAEQAVAEETARYAPHAEALANLQDEVDAAHAMGNEEAYKAAVEKLSAAYRVAFTEMSIARHALALAKAPAVAEHVHALLDDGVGKVVCFGHHKDVIASIATALGAYNPVTLTGDTPMEERQRAVDSFQANPACRVFVGSIQAAGVGLTLTASSNVVFVELDWVPGNMSQAEDRCILEGQKVLTPDGWRKIEDIHIGDVVITRAGIGRVSDAWSRGCRKQVTELVVEGWREPIAMTSDHQCLLESGEWLEAGNLRPGDRLARPAHVGSYRESIAFDSDCRLPNEFVGIGGNQRNGRLIKAPNSVLLNDDALFVFGYYAGDGFSSTGKDKGRFVSFAGNDGSKRESLARCRRWCESNGMTVSEYAHPGDHGVELRGYSGEWALWFRKHFLHHAKNKRLPEFLMHLDERQSALVLSGLIASDGYRRNGHAEYVTASDVLASQVARIVVAAGKAPTVNVNSTGQTLVAFAESGCGTAGLVRQVTHRFPKKYKDMRERVYDLTIDSDPSFVLGMSVVHNCHRIGQHDSVHVQHLVFDRSLDAHLARTLVEKQAVLDQALDTEPEPLRAPPAKQNEDQREARPRTYPVPSNEQRAAAHAAIRFLAARCDGARVEDAAGFNKMDTLLGHKLAALANLSNSQTWLATKLARKYRRQLGADLRATLGLDS